MSLKKDSISLRDESLLTDKTKTRIAIFVTSLNISFESVLRTNIKTSHYFTIIRTKSLR